MFEEKRFVAACIQINRKIIDPLNAKEHYESFLRKKKTKSPKQSNVNTQQTKTFENLNIVDIKSIIIEHPKTSNKLIKTIIQTAKVSHVGSGRSSSSLYIVIQKSENF